jgi:N-acetylneuraminic acid mutarotase
MVMEPVPDASAIAGTIACVQTRGSSGRLALVLPLAAFVAAMVALATAGSPNRSHSSSAAASSTTASSSSAQARRASGVARTFGASPHVTATFLGALPTAVEDSAVAPAGAGRLALLGGIDAAQSSTDQVTILVGASATTGGTLPAPQHDAQAARLGSYVYVFGGGAVSSYDHILRYDPTSGRVSSAGTLPSDASDVAVATLGKTAYVVGGYDGVRPLDTILAWRPGARPRVVAHLPTGLRYAAVAPAGGRLIIAGGTAGPSEALSDAVYGFDPASGALTRIGHLPVALTHASAAALDGQVLIVGGRRALSGDQTSEILAIDPATGRVRVAGRLPAPLSDAAVAVNGDRVIVAGGEAPTGVQRNVIALIPKVA